MFSVKTTGEVYSVVFMIVLLAFPFIGLADDNGIPLVVVLESTILISLVLTFWRCSSPILGYFRGLSFVAGHWRVGIVQLSMVVAPFVLLWMHGLATMVAIGSLAFGQDWGRRQYLRLVNTLSRGNLNLPAALTALEQAR